MGSKRNCPNDSTDQTQVQENRRDCRDRKSTSRIEDAACHGNQRDKEKIRKGKPQSRHGRCVLIGLLNKTRRDYRYQPWCTQNPQQCKKQQNQRQSTQHQVQKGSHLGGGIPRFVFCIDRYKTCRKSTLGKNSPEKIGNPERNKESIRDQSTTQELRKRNITDKSGYPR